MSVSCHNVDSMFSEMNNIVSVSCPNVECTFSDIINIVCVSCPNVESIFSEIINIVSVSCPNVDSIFSEIINIVSLSCPYVVSMFSKIISLYKTSLSKSFKKYFYSNWSINSINPNLNHQYFVSKSFHVDSMSSEIINIVLVSCPIVDSMF